MSLFDRLRREPIPAQVKATVDPADRLLAWAAAGEDAYVVATRCGLRLADGTFLPWQRIDKAVWRDGELSLTEAVEVEPDVLEGQPPVTIALEAPRNVPAIIQSRVTQSVAHTSRHALPGGAAVRVVGRRVPGQDGLEWSLRYESGADRHDGDVREAAMSVLADTRATIRGD